MLRMAHRIATIQNVAGVLECQRDSEGLREELRGRFLQYRNGCQQAVFVVADNVSDYYWSSPKESWSTRADFPSCLPFANCVHVEWSSVRTSTGGVRVRTENGCLLTASDRIDDDQSGNFDDLADDVRWIVQASFTEVFKGEFFYVAPFVQLTIDYDGNVSPAAIRGIHANSAEAKQAIADSMHCRLHIPLLAMSFANCKNVTRTELTGKEVEPDRPWVRKHNPPQIKYHVLNINPMKEVLRTEGRSDEVGIQKALHLCRGHFAHYTEEKPLFGKYAGQFWVPQHTRGKAERGMVLKDYSIGPVK